MMEYYFNINKGKIKKMDMNEKPVGFTFNKVSSEMQWFVFLK